MVLAIHPGDPSTHHYDLQVSEVERSPISPLDTFLDVVRNMFPENVVQASFTRVKTTYVGTPKRLVAGKGGIGKPEHSLAPLGSPGALLMANYSIGAKKRIENMAGMNILGNPLKDCGVKWANARIC